MEKLNFEVLTKNKLIEELDQLILLDKEAFESEAWDQSSFLYDLPGKFNYSILIYLNNQLIGYSINSIKSEYCHIHRFVVKNTFNNLGLGSKMIDFLVQEFKLSKISLKVNSNNFRAINFYFKKKFKIIELNNNYYTMIKHG